MKILIYENSSGFSSYTSKLCEALVKNEAVRIDYITVENNEYLKNVDERINVLPILKSFDSSKKKSFFWFFNRIYVGFINIIRRNRFCKKNKYDAISIQSTNPVIDRFFIKKFCKQNENVVYTVHDVIPPIRSFSWSKGSLKKMYRSVDKMIVHTEENKRQLVDVFSVPEERIYVVNHGTDVDYVKLDKERCRAELGLDKEKVVLLFYGLIREQKGLDDLIRAMKGLKDCQLFIAGAMPHGESFDAYDSLIKDTGIDAVKMIKFVPEEMTDTVFNSCDVICLPYKYFYSQSGVFMQSIKYRKPVVVSDVSSFREYLNDYSIGILCNPNDPDDLRKKLEELISVLKLDPDRFSADLEKAAKDNSWETSAKKYLTVFSDKGL